MIYIPAYLVSHRREWFPFRVWFISGSLHVVSGGLSVTFLPLTCVLLHDNAYYQHPNLIQIYNNEKNIYN